MPNSSTSRVEAVTASLRDDILKGQYRPGERLPSERDLAAKFEVNRGVVREAFKKLEQIGIAAINPGGVRVVPIEEASLSVLGHLVDLQTTPDAALIDQMLDVLGVLMAMLAKAAVQQASDDEIAQMQTIVGRMVKTTEQSAESQNNWKELGTLFAQINNNLVLRLILNGLKANFLERGERPDAPHLQFDQAKNREIFKRLAASITSRDAQGTAQAVSDHFQLVRETVQELLQNPTFNKDFSA